MELTYTTCAENYMKFTKTTNDKSIISNFVKELRQSDNWDNSKICENILTNYAKNNIKIKCWESTNNSEFKNPIYMIMLTCFNDHLMEKMGREFGFLRGFPILYIPNIKINFFGFKTKFKNEVKQAIMPENFKGLAWFLKFSGFLGQLCSFMHENKYYWTFCSKNSCDYTNKFCSDGAKLFEPYISKVLLKRMITCNIHLCAEMMSKNDQSHGSRVYNQMPVITSMAKGMIIDIKNKGIYNKPIFGYISTYGFNETIEFCKQYGLKVGDAVICSNLAAKEIVKKFHESCDIMDNNIYNKILGSILEKYGEFITIVKGTMTHEECLGNVLEGLVIHQIKCEKELTHRQVVDHFENKNIFEDVDNNISKYKYPGYTVRTMCIRQSISENIKIGDYDSYVNRWASHWCITEKGKNYWYKFAWAVKIMMDSNKDYGYKDLSIGKHIYYSDYVLEHKLPPNIDSTIAEILSKNLKLKTKITVVAPFYNEADYSKIKEFLESKDYVITLSEKNVPKNSPGYIYLTKIPLNSSKSTGQIFQMSLNNEALESLETWQSKKLNSISTENIVEAKNLEHLNFEINKYIKTTYSNIKSNDEIKETEQKLVSRNKDILDNIISKLKELESERKLGVIVVVGIQCLGKSTLFNELIKIIPNITQCSADLIMGNVFDPSKLISCHKECQIEVIKALKSNNHAFVDNQNINASHRTIYKVYADLFGATYVPIILCKDMWLNVDRKIANKTLDALEYRSKQRELKTGKTIKRDVIQKSITNANNDFNNYTKSQKDNSIANWLNYFPRPIYIKGLSYFNSNIFPTKKNKSGVFSYSSDKLLEIVDKYLNDDRFKSIENINEALATYYSKRTFGNHITIIEPREIKMLKSKSVVVPHIDTIKYEDNFDIVGLGKTSQESNSTFYLVVNWQWAQDFRASLGLEHKDLHCTIAFTENDIFNVPKNDSTIIFK